MRRIALVAAVTLAVGCGTTTIVTNDRNARIYVNGVMVGKGTAEVRQRGFPGSSQVVIKSADGRTSSQSMRRHFTGTTLLFGLFTYTIGWIACWEYPDSVFVEVEAAPAAAPSGWDADDVWMRPPAGWEPAPPGGASAPPPPE